MKGKAKKTTEQPGNWRQFNALLTQRMRERFGTRENPFRARHFSQLKGKP